jgi:hypothetical protein
MCDTYVSNPIVLYNIYIFLLSFFESPNLFYCRVCVEVYIYLYLCIWFVVHSLLKKLCQILIEIFQVSLLSLFPYALLLQWTEHDAFLIHFGYAV